MSKSRNRPRRPAYRREQLKPHQKALVWVQDKWRTFQGYSRRKKIAIIGGSITAVLIVIPIASHLYFVRDINDPERLMNRNSTGIVITDRNDEVIYSYGRTANEQLYRLPEISDHMEQALIASEDKNFYEHGGFSFKAIVGALIANVLNLDISRYGGSTLTQQLVKNNLLSSSKNFLRKYQELSISIAIERTYTKDEILEMYLNSVYYGEGAFGIERAAEVYFDKKPQDLTLAESSMLVGLLPAPSAYSPVSGDAELAKQEQERVLTQMVEAGYITEEQKQAAFDKKLAYAETSEDDQEHGHHFTSMIIDQLNERYGEERVTRSGFRVTSTLNLDAQKFAEQQVKNQVAALNYAGANNASLVAIDPDTGQIKALVGSVNWNNKQFGQVNMATTPRQPGSSFKPIYYAEAIDKRIITAGTVLKDERRTFGDGYTPENYDFRFRGDITARHALAQSLNIPAIEVLEKLGIDNAVQTAQRMGLDTVTESEEYGLPLALGTAEAELIDMTNAYAAFANQGIQYEPSGILAIHDKYGKQIYDYDEEARSDRVQSREASFIISSILSDEAARAPLSGAQFNLPGRSVAVKTGSTNDNIDAWTIGYTPNLAVGVWVGDNKHRPMQVGGTTAAGPIWRATMQHMLEGTPVRSFQRPSTVVKQLFCGVNGTYDEYFIDGTQPDECYVPPPPEPEKKDDEEEQERENDSQEDDQTDTTGNGNGTGTEDTPDDTDGTIPDDGTTDGDGATDGGDGTTDPGDGSTTDDGTTDNGTDVNGTTQDDNTIQ